MDINVAGINDRKVVKTLLTKLMHCVPTYFDAHLRATHVAL
jgi:hypothetical protein